jgi:hypothetical protein
MDLEWLDDETVLPSVLLTELDEHTQALFKQIRTFNCGMPIVRFLIENECNMHRALPRPHAAAR